MKVISKEEERAHYNAVLRGGAIGGACGLAASLLAVYGASRRYPAFRNLTLQFRAFLVSSGTTATTIIVAERASINFAKAKDPMNFYKDEAERQLEEARHKESELERFMDWGRENRYTIVLSSWVASIALALALVSRNRFLTTSQKLVQARVYAQGLTLAVLLATAAFETMDAQQGKGHWETVKVLDPNDPEHKHLIEKRIHKEEYAGQDLWKDMVAAEERRIEAQKKQRAAESGEATTDKASAPAK